jgi:hypothetical protein
MWILIKAALEFSYQGASVTERRSRRTLQQSVSSVLHPPNPGFFLYHPENLEYIRYIQVVVPIGNPLQNQQPPPPLSTNAAQIVPPIYWGADSK